MFVYFPIQLYLKSQLCEWVNSKEKVAVVDFVADLLPPLVQYKLELAVVEVSQ